MHNKTGIFFTVPNDEIKWIVSSTMAKYSIQECLNTWFIIKHCSAFTAATIIYITDIMFALFNGSLYS